MQNTRQASYSHYDYVLFEGPDASAFLQGQVSCNLEQLSPENSLTGALCNLKGRVIADFRLLLLDGDKILLQSAAGNGKTIHDTLARYAVFSKVSLSLAGAPVELIHICTESALQGLEEYLPALPASDNQVTRNEDFLLIRVAGVSNRYQLWCLSDAAVAIVESAELPERLTSADCWLLGDIQAGIAHISPYMAEKYTPQLLNYDVSGVIDFEKGCYTGQEVVARMHYRAKAKKRLYRLRSAQKLSTESEITTADAPGKPAVEILAAASGDDTAAFEALGIVSTELAESGTALVLAGSGAAAVEVLPITYPADAS